MSDDIFEFEFWPEELHLIGTPATKIPPLMAKAESKEKGNKKMKKSDPEYVALVKQLKAMQKAVDGLPRNNGAVGSLSTVAAVHDRVFSHLGNPWQAFDNRVNAAEADLTKAKANGNEYAMAAARAELHQARNSLTLFKLRTAEQARLNDPATVQRRMNGQGVPLLTNRHALPDDSSLRYDG